MGKRKSTKYEIKNIASSTESAIFPSFGPYSGEKDICRVCGRKMQLIYGDPQQGEEYRCSNLGCMGGSRILPLDPPCGCSSQPCEHTQWHLPHHIVAKRPSWFDRLGYKILRFMKLE